MGTRSVNAVLHRAALISEVADLTDGELLELFLRQRDEAAFETLIHRHGAMVFGVCRRMIGDIQDAEDAFQATFLVLVQKAASVVPREAVGNWLFGVAVRTARRVRAVNARRSGREKSGQDVRQFSTDPTDTTQKREALAILDEELSHLPEKYRLPLVLCDLESRPRREVARQLALPEGTLSSQLATARKLLAGRLARRGVSLSAGALATVLSRNAASAGLPAALAVSTSKAASLFVTTGQVAVDLVSARVAALTGAVMKAMFLTKLRFATALVVSLGVLFGAGLLAHEAWAAQPPRDNRVADASPTKDMPESQPVADQPAPPKPGDKPKPTIWQEKATARAREVDALAFAPDGRTLVLSQGFRGSGRAYGISILDATTLKELHSFKHEPGTAQFVGFGADGTALVLRGVGNKDPKNELEFKEAELIELATGKRRAVVDHGYWTDARLSPDGKILVAARQGRVSLFDTTTGKTLDRFLAHGAAIMDRLAFSDGNTLVVLGIQSLYVVKLSPHDLTVYDVTTRKTLGSYNSADADARKYAQAFRFDAPTAFANKRATEYLSALKPRKGEELSPYTSALTRDGKTLALNWRPQHHLPTEQQLPAHVQLIDLDSGQEITSIPAPGDATAVAFSPDGKRLVIGASGVILWESADANFVTLDGSDKNIKPGDFGYRIETATADGRVTVRIILNEEAVRSFGDAQLHLTRDGKTVLKTTIALQRDADYRSGTLELTLDKGTSDDGELLFRCRPIAAAPAVKDFGGFRLSVKNLLGSAPSK